MSRSPPNMRARPRTPCCARRRRAHEAAMRLETIARAIWTRNAVPAHRRAGDVRSSGPTRASPTQAQPQQGEESMKVRSVYLGFAALAAAALVAIAGAPASAQQIAVGNFGVSANGMPF